MEKRDNYVIAAAQARKLFLNYDHEYLAKKLRTPLDETYLYTRMLGEPYRIHRQTGDIDRQKDGQWIQAHSFGESLTLLDLVCDSSEHRTPAGVWKNMPEFGLQFHSQSSILSKDSQAEYFQSHLDSFCCACEALGGKRYPKGDAAYIMELFDGLQVLIQLWLSDEDFPAQLCWLWDANAKMYLKYETMYYAVGLILSRIQENMEYAHCVRGEG